MTIKSPQSTINNKTQTASHVPTVSSLNSPQSALSKDQQPSERLKLLFTERIVDIQRPVNYSLRGFGFLLNTGVGSTDFINTDLYLLVRSDRLAAEEEGRRSFEFLNYAQIVVVEPDTLADRAGLRKGDLVVEINDEPTRDLSNEQLRRIMRNRLQTNEIRMKILSQESSEKAITNFSTTNINSILHDSVLGI